jgi:Domain of unknown function (DUF4145)
VSNTEKRFTSTQRCDHCGNSAPMEIVSIYSGVKTYDDYPRSNLSWECGSVYELLACPVCEAVSLRSYYWHDQAIDPSDIEFETLYPGRQEGPLGLPSPIKRAHDAAQKVRNIDANAYGVLLGRLLELVCADREAKGDSLNKCLEYLAQKGEIPEKLVGVAKGLRNFRNVGAHATLGELTPAELPILDNLCRAILEYVYSAPFLAQEAEDRLRKLKNAI